MDHQLITKKQFTKNLELVLDCVIPYIQDTDDLNSISLVSKKFFHIDSKTRKHVTVHVHYLPDPSRLSLRFPELESLKLKSYSYGRESYGARLCCIPVTPWIQEISVKFTRLKSLCIRNMVVSACDLQLLATTRGGNIKSLEIWGCKMFSEDGLVDIARCCKDLRRLRLECNHIDGRANGKWLHELALCNTVVESLDIRCPFDTYDMKDVTLIAKKCSKSLVSLRIEPQSLSNFREVFDCSKKLGHFGYGVTDENWDYSGFEFPRNIRGLRIEELHEYQFPFLHPFLNQLRELDLDCGPIRRNCQCVLFQNCPNLEVLHTDDICEDEGLQVIGQFCKKLRKLTHNGLVTHVGMIALVKGCTNLESLEVRLGDISNEAIECVGTYLKNLRKVRMNLVNKNLTTDLPLDNGVRAMLMGCNKLERLDISNLWHWHGGLTDVGLEYIGKYGVNLRSLSVTLRGNSNAGLVNLSKGCPNLRKLKLSFCLFCEQALSSFVFNMPSLKYVWFDSSDRHRVVWLTRPGYQF